MGRFGIAEILIVAVVILLLFGPRRLPEIGAAIGKAIREFQASLKGGKNDGADPKKPE